MRNFYVCYKCKEIGSYAIDEELGIDDSRVFACAGFKCQDTLNRPYTEVRIEFIKEERYSEGYDVRKKEEANKP
jgi:hypothetical protein